jgi:peroxin-3
VNAAFTRTLTTLYSITLLCLLTTIQLTVLARSKYVNSVLDAEREEMFREQLESQLSLPNLLLSQSTRMIQDLLSVDLSILDDDEVEMGDLEGDGITQEVERKFLTLSWWILHVGWKDVGERVRRGVEEVFEGFVGPGFRHQITDSDIC